MPKRTSAQIKSQAQMAKKIFLHHFGKAPDKIAYQAAGKTNFVFEITSGRKNYIVKISRSQEKLHDFIKEQWVVQKAHEQGVPVPEILEVGSEVVRFPYMLQQSVKGDEAVNHPLRSDILCDLGEYAKL